MLYIFLAVLINQMLAQRASTPHRVALLWVCSLGVLLCAWCDQSVADFFRAHTDVSCLLASLLVLWMAVPFLYNVRVPAPLDWPVRGGLLFWVCAAAVAEAEPSRTVATLGVAMALVASLLPLSALPGLLLVALTGMAVLNERTWDVRYPFAVFLTAMVVTLVKS